MESGVAINPWALKESSSNTAYKFCEHLGFKSRDHKKILEFLQTVDSKKLIAAQEKVELDSPKNVSKVQKKINFF